MLSFQLFFLCPFSKAFLEASLKLIYVLKISVVWRGPFSSSSLGAETHKGGVDETLATLRLFEVPLTRPGWRAP